MTVANRDTRLDRTVQRLATCFRAAGLDTPALDARMLVAAALGLDRVAMLRVPERQLSAAEIDAIEALAARRLRREPVSRILGRRWFHGLEFEIDPATLDPRPETETLVDGVLTRLRDRGLPEHSPIGILDLGTGSGAILIALLVALPSARGLGTDRSEPALEVARRNASRHGVADRADFRNANWYDGVEPARYDVIVSNPPYIARADVAHLDVDVRDYDPRAALDGGADGLDAYRAIVASASAFLAHEGLLVLEVGAGQAANVARLCADGGLVPEPLAALWRDLSGHPRCVAATRLS